MKNRSKLALVLSLVALAFAPSLAFADDGGDLVITNVVIENGQPYITANGAPNPAGCQTTAWLALPTDGSSREDYVSAVETAVASGMKVHVFTNGCANSPWGTVPVIYSVYLHR